MAKFEVYLAQDNQYRWRLKAANGEIVSHGEGHPNKAGAKRSAETVKRLAPVAQMVEI